MTVNSSCWWARRGAAVTGVDFSEHSIGLARNLATELGFAEARFVRSDVFGLPEVLDETVRWMDQLAVQWDRRLADVKRLLALLAIGGTAQAAQNPVATDDSSYFVFGRALFCPLDMTGSLSSERRKSSFACSRQLG